MNGVLVFTLAIQEKMPGPAQLGEFFLLWVTLRETRKKRIADGTVAGEYFGQTEFVRFIQPSFQVGAEAAIREGPENAKAFSNNSGIFRNEIFRVINEYRSHPGNCPFALEI